MFHNLTVILLALLGVQVARVLGAVNTTAIFQGDNALIVITSGSGTLSLVVYDPDVSGLRSALVGGKTTTNTGNGRWVVSFTHDYLSYGIMWDGAGQAVYSIGSSLEAKPVGRSWSQATYIRWGDSSASTKDVSGSMGGATRIGDGVTIFAIPKGTC